MKTLKLKLIIGIIIITFTNIIALAGVLYNRTGQPTSSVTLSERELYMPYSWHEESLSDSENTALSLRIDFERSQHLTDMRLNKQQLEGLGFTFMNKEYSFWTSSRTFYWALEFDGKHYAEDLEAAKNELLNAQQLMTDARQQDDKKDLSTANQELERKQARFDRVEQTQSRLYVVDFDGNLESLQQKFAGQSNVIFMQGIVKPYKHYELYAKMTSEQYIDSALNSEKQDLQYGLRFSNLLVSNVHIPLEMTGPLQSLSSKKYNEISPPRYAVELKVGRRLEPFIQAVSRLDYEK